MLEEVGGCSWGKAGGWMPLPTRPQRYCDPASLVLFVSFFHCRICKDQSAQSLSVENPGTPSISFSCSSKSSEPSVKPQTGAECVKPKTNARAESLIY